MCLLSIKKHVILVCSLLNMRTIFPCVFIFCLSRISLGLYYQKNIFESRGAEKKDKGGWS